MRVLWHAIRAATIETLGVALIIVILFGIPTWALAGNSGGSSPQRSVSTWFESLRDSFRGRMAVAKPNDEARQRYAEQRLSHYSHAIGRAASDHVKRVINEPLLETRS